MAQKRDIRIVKQFKEKLSEDVPVKKLFLFGSRASGKPKRWSDFDIMIVSNTFKGVESYERPLGFHNYWDADYPVDFLCYTPEEFKKLKRQITIVREAVEHGIEI